MTLRSDKGLSARVFARSIFPLPQPPGPHPIMLLETIISPLLTAPATDSRALVLMVGSVARPTRLACCTRCPPCSVSKMWRAPRDFPSESSWEPPLVRLTRSSLPAEPTGVCRPFPSGPAFGPCCADRRCSTQDTGVNKHQPHCC